MPVEDASSDGRARRGPTLHLDSTPRPRAARLEPAWELGRALEEIVDWFSAYAGGGEMRRS